MLTVDDTKQFPKGDATGDSLSTATATDRPIEGLHFMLRDPVGIYLEGVHKAYDTFLKTAELPVTKETIDDAIKEELTDAIRRPQQLLLACTRILQLQQTKTDIINRPYKEICIPLQAVIDKIAECKDIKLPLSLFAYRRVGFDATLTETLSRREQKICGNKNISPDELWQQMVVDDRITTNEQVTQLPIENPLLRSSYEEISDEELKNVREAPFEILNQIQALVIKAQQSIPFYFPKEISDSILDVRISTQQLLNGLHQYKRCIKLANYLANGRAPKTSED